MFTFDRFNPGTIYGECAILVSEEETKTWCSLFGGRPSLFMPNGMVSVIAIRAYLSIITPRPPGNIHGASYFKLYSRLRVGCTIVTSVSCESKAVSKGRRIVQIAVKGRASGTAAFDARITSLVAA